MTFRVECFIEDKSLGDALHALARIKGVEIPAPPQPVVNRSKGGSAIHGSRMEAALSCLEKMPATFDIKMLKVHLASVGINDPNYYLQKWKKGKLVRLKERGVWVRLPHKVASA